MQKITTCDVQRAWAHNEPGEMPTMRELDEQIRRDIDVHDARRFAVHRAHRLRMVRRNARSDAA